MVKRRNKKIQPGKKKQKTTGETIAEKLPGTCALPFEVIQEILEIAGDIQLLKTGRLVSKSWNELSCRILRKTAAVVVDEGDESTLEDFQKVLFNHMFKFPSEWPNPFQNYTVIAEGLKSSSFVSFCHSPYVKITLLEFTHTPDLDIKILGDLLKRHQQSLIRLSIKARSTTTFINDPELLTGLCLSTLELSDSCTISPCEHMKFSKLVMGPKLERLVLKGRLENITSCFTTPTTRWTKLRVLHLEFSNFATNKDVNIECLTRVGEVEAPSLSSLTIIFAKPDPKIQAPKEYTDCVLPLMQRAGPNLRSLSTNCLPLNLILPCPKLERLKSDFYGYRLEFITEERFPSLTTLDCSIYWAVIPTYVHCKPTNKKVRSLTISDTLRDNAANFTIWPIAYSLFPHLQGLAITSKHLSRDDYAIMGKWYRIRPLPSLELRNVDETDLLTFEHAGKYFQSGWNGFSLAMDSFIRFREVQRLIFGPEVLVTKSIVQYYLLELDKLTHLGFYWNPALSAAWLAKTDLCKRLKSLSITYQVESQKEEMRTLKKLWPILSLKYERAGRD